MIPVSGLCRFSYPSGGGFKASNAQLYDEDRLSRRLQIFSELTLPSILGQSDQNFKFGVLIGDDLPTQYKSQLAKICEASSNIVIISEKPGRPHVEVCSEAIMSLRPAGAKYVIEFRLDDDDAVAFDFIEKARETSTLLIEGGLREVVEISFPRGYYLDVRGEPVVSEKILAHLACAQAWMIPVHRQRTMFKFHHYNFWRRGMCLTIPHDPMYLRGIHETNDSTINQNELEGARPLVEMEEEIIARFKFMRDRFNSV